MVQPHWESINLVLKPLLLYFHRNNMCHRWEKQGNNHLTRIFLTSGMRCSVTSQTDTQTDIANSRRKWPRALIHESKIYIIFVWLSSEVFIMQISFKFIYSQHFVIWDIFEGAEKNIFLFFQTSRTSKTGGCPNIVVFFYLCLSYNIRVFSSEVRIAFK